MSNKPFRFHPEAREEFREAARWYRARDAVVAAEFREIGSATIRLVVQSPQRWMKYLYGTRRLLMKKFPFSVVYLDDPDLITIIAVAHGKRKPGYWKSRI